MVAMSLFLQAQLAAPVVIWGAFVMARLFAGHLDTRRRAAVENLKLFWLYTASQGLVAVLLIHGLPRVLA
jgi:cytochrome c oxidase subunit I+III